MYQLKIVIEMIMLFVEIKAALHRTGSDTCIKLHIKNMVPYKYLLILTLETPRNAELGIMNQGGKVCFVWDFCFLYPSEKISSYIVIDDVFHKFSI